MKTRLSLFCVAITMLLNFSIANAQQFGGPGLDIGGQQPAFRAVSGDLLQPGLPGRLWFETNWADQGLGFNGSFVTLGGKTRLFQDYLDGRWLFETELNHSIDDDGGFFLNIGIERVFSIKSANADISFGVFYDYDNDDQQTFSNGFHQIGVSGAVKTRYFDLIGNGYIPVGTDEFTLADPTGENIFVGNNIAIQAGIESALQGFDFTLRTRPKQLAFVNGYVDFGAYHYDSDLVDSFAGGRLRAGMQIFRGLTVAAEVNHDERFDTTGVVSVGYIFGATNSGRGSEYAGLARDLEKFARNDHIVRFSQDLVVAVNPLTGMPFNVIHANNLQQGIGDGTADSPFATLAEAEAASSINDIILVDIGDGTDTGYQDGITLQDGQQLLSGGGTNFIPNIDGTLVQVTDGTGGAATISNAGGTEVVLLADNNTLGGINIDALDADFGVLGVGISGGTFSSVMSSSATFDGVSLQGVSGDFDFVDNVFTNNFQDGVFVDGSTDPTSIFNFENNIVDFNFFEGIHLADFDAAEVILTGNQTSNNGRNGTYLENAIDSNGDGIDITITSHVADANGESGVAIEEGTGNIIVAGGTFTNNAGDGLTITNWETDIEGDAITIGALDDGTQPVFSGNAAGIKLNLDSTLTGVGLTNTVDINDVTVDANVRGIVATSIGEDTVINLNVGGATSITNNAQEAIAQLVENGGTINSLIEGDDAANQLIIAGNSFEGASSLDFKLDGDVGTPASVINSVVRNVNVMTAGGPALEVDGMGESQINLLVEDSLLQSPGVGVLVNLDNTPGGLINTTSFDNVDIQGNFGFIGNSQAGTLWDLSITNSLVRSSGILAENSAPFSPAAPAAFGPFTDANGSTGITITADGGGFVGDLVNDNLTRVTLLSNTIEDFTFDGINIVTTGDAQLLANFSANDILRNGPGQNDDGASDDGILDGPTMPVDPTEGLFFNGVDITALDNSTISVDFLNNTFLNNFDRSLNITTIGNGQFNASIIGNRFASDIGVDATMAPLDFFAGEIGVTNMGGNIGLSLSTNTFGAAPIQIFNGAAPNVTIGLDGLSNGFPAAVIPGAFTPTAFGLSDIIIDAEEAFFETSGGFPDLDP